SLVKHEALKSTATRPAAGAKSASYASSEVTRNDMVEYRVRAVSGPGEERKFTSSIGLT
ncbi:MAG: hypothetical protein QOF30_1042, partial [Acidimicrobiaceae bacterium]|nr:hypothetical protein [Acidimicrobiaceae bacterium]